MGRTRKKARRKVVKAKHKRIARKRGASKRRSGRELIRDAMKKKKATLVGAAKFVANGHASHDNGKSNGHRPVRTTEVEAAVQRFVDLYDFAPIAYVSFDRSGHVREVNVAAAKLLGLSQKQLTDRSFTANIYPPDIDIFLNHLLRCRSSKSRVRTELRIVRVNKERIPVELSSTLTAIKD